MIQIHRNTGYQNRSAVIFICFSCVLWVGLWLLRFPRPQWDDLFFLGTSVEYAQNSRLANPWLRDFLPLLEYRYFIHPPFYFVATGGWIRVFGLSTTSLTALQCFWCLVASAALAFALHMWQFRAWWIVPILFAATFGDRGMRPDVMALAFLFAGTALAFRSGAWLQTLGISLQIGSVAVYAPISAYSIPILIFTLIAFARRRWLIITTASCIIVGILFLQCIDFRLREFLDDMSWHYALRRTAPSQLLSELAFQFGNGFSEILVMPVFILVLAIFLIACFNPQIACVKTRTLLSLVIVSLLVNVFLYTGTLTQFGRLAAWIGVAICIPEMNLPLTLRRYAIIFVVGLFLISQTYWFVGLVAHDADRENHYSRSQFRIPAHMTPVIDEMAARLVFNYKLPANSLAWNFSGGAKIVWPRDTASRKANHLWVLSAAKADWCRGLPTVPRVELLGRRFRSMPAEASRVIMYPPLSTN